MGEITTNLTKEAEDEVLEEFHNVLKENGVKLSKKLDKEFLEYLEDDFWEWVRDNIDSWMEDNV